MCWQVERSILDLDTDYQHVHYNNVWNGMEQSKFFHFCHPVECWFCLYSCIFLHFLYMNNYLGNLCIIDVCNGTSLIFLIDVLISREEHLGLGPVGTDYQPLDYNNVWRSIQISGTIHSLETNACFHRRKSESAMLLVSCELEQWFIKLKW